MTELLAQVNLPTNFFRGTRWPSTIDRFLATTECTTGGITPAASCNFQPGILITVLLPNALMVAGIIFFIWMIAAGWAFLGSAGREANAQEKAKAQAALTYAVIGFLLIITAFFILQIIEKVTGIKFIRPRI
ncbi:MAG: hypothetical protein AAB768_02375 [Patescibacteria group bacterium]